MALQPIPYPTTHDDDVEAAIADERYRRALQQVTVFDVISTACQLLADEEDLRRHPLYHLAAHVLRNGSYRRSGKAAHMSDSLTRAMEDVLDRAVEMCVVDVLQSDERADLALDLE
jgi:hypothetical protein